MQWFSKHVFLLVLHHYLYDKILFLFTLIIYLHFFLFVFFFFFNQYLFYIALTLLYSFSSISALYSTNFTCLYSFLSIRVLYRQLLFLLLVPGSVEGRCRCDLGVGGRMGGLSDGHAVISGCFSDTINPSLPVSSSSSMFYISLVKALAADCVVILIKWLNHYVAL